MHDWTKDLEKIISKQTPAYLAMKILEQNGYGAVNASKASVDIEKSANNMISKVLTDKSDAVGYVEVHLLHSFGRIYVKRTWHF